MAHMCNRQCWAMLRDCHELVEWAIWVHWLCAVVNLGNQPNDDEQRILGELDMSPDLELESQVRGFLETSQAQQSELLKQVARAAASPRPELVRVSGGGDLSDPEFNQEILSQNADRLLSYLRSIRDALEARAWFARPAMDAKTSVSRERADQLAALGDFCLEIADASRESLIKDLQALEYRDQHNRFDLHRLEAPAKRGFWR